MKRIREKTLDELFPEIKEMDRVVKILDGPPTKMRKKNCLICGLPMKGDDDKESRKITICHAECRKKRLEEIKEIIGLYPVDLVKFMDKAGPERRLVMKNESDRLLPISQKPFCVLCDKKDGQLRKCTDCANAIHVSHQEKKCGKCSPTNGTLLPFCMMCWKKDGELLACPVDGCISAIHEKCMILGKCPCHYCMYCASENDTLSPSVKIGYRTSCYYCGTGYCDLHRNWRDGFSYQKENPNICFCCSNHFQ